MTTLPTCQTFSASRAGRALARYIVAAIMLALLLAGSGCAAVQRVSEAAAERVESGYEIGRAAADRADEYKAQVAEDNLDRARDQIEFSASFGEQVDDAGLDWLDAHLQRLGNFVCDLKARGVTLEDIATRDPAAVARVRCLDAPQPPPSE